MNSENEHPHLTLTRLTVVFVIIEVSLSYHFIPVWLKSCRILEHQALDSLFVNCFSFLQIRLAVMDDQCVSHSSPKRSGGQTNIEVQVKPSVIKCGWLRKQGGFVKTWHSRWFVLRGDQLYYYKDEEETKSLVSLQTH